MIEAFGAMSLVASPSDVYATVVSTIEPALALLEEHGLLLYGGPFQQYLVPT